MRAVHADDRELDTALVCLGILPPVELADIRAWLSLTGIELHARTNSVGHRVIEIAIGRRTVARIHPDGNVVANGQAPLLNTA